MEPVRKYYTFRREWFDTFQALEQKYGLVTAGEYLHMISLYMLYDMVPPKNFFLYPCFKQLHPTPAERRRTAVYREKRRLKAQGLDPESVSLPRNEDFGGGAEWDEEAREFFTAGTKKPMIPAPFPDH